MPVDVTLYRTWGGSLVCLTTIRINLSYVVGTVSGFIACTKDVPWNAGKIIIWRAKRMVHHDHEYVHRIMIASSWLYILI